MQLRNSKIPALVALLALPATAFSQTVNIDTELVSSTSSSATFEFDFSGSISGQNTTASALGNTTRTIFISLNDPIRPDDFVISQSTNPSQFGPNTNVSTLVSSNVTATGSQGTFALQDVTIFSPSQPNPSNASTIPARIGFIFDSALAGDPAFSGTTRVTFLATSEITDANYLGDLPIAYAENRNQNTLQSIVGQTTAVPEPMSAPVLGAAAIALAFVARRKRA